MTHAFLIFGYGIPKNILTDQNYRLYLIVVFNKIYEAVVKDKTTQPLIIFCGGKTDCVKPYKRTEAEEMMKWIAATIKQKPFLKPLTKDWTLVAEKSSLSALENLLHSQKILKRRVPKAKLTVFCEHTRGKRIKTMAQKVFGTNYQVRVQPIDFDASANRYLSPAFIAKKEKAELKQALWALQSPQNLKQHHRLLKKRLVYLRQAGSKGHTKAVLQWWEQEL